MLTNLTRTRRSRLSRVAAKLRPHRRLGLQVSLRIPGLQSLEASESNPFLELYLHGDQVELDVEDSCLGDTRMGVGKAVVV